IAEDWNSEALTILKGFEGIGCLFFEGREVKKLRGKEIPLVKVVWGGAAGESLT
ncbi:hypothetical protein MTR_1434s0010, partial [Medicago truncatula]